MTDDFYKKAFNSALEELATLAKRRTLLKKELLDLEDRMEKLRQGAVGLASLANVEFHEIKENYPDLFEDEIDPRMGITDAVRETLRASQGWLTPVDVRNRLYLMIPAIASHKNPLASIHAVLRRLVDKGEVVSGSDAEKRTVYAWIGSDEAIRRLYNEFAKEREKESFISVIREIKGADWKM
jgi:hypothetical protein